MGNQSISLAAIRGRENVHVHIILQRSPFSMGHNTHTLPYCTRKPAPIQRGSVPSSAKRHKTCKAAMKSKKSRKAESDLVRVHFQKSLVHFVWEKPKFQKRNFKRQKVINFYDILLLEGLLLTSCSRSTWETAGKPSTRSRPNVRSIDSEGFP